MKNASLLLTFVVLTSLPVAGATLYQTPTLSRTSIAFAYAGDLWSVPREGGVARRLTSHVGIESDPHYSPDGSLVAFTGEYDGNTDVFVMAAGGGVPRRLTFHPGEDAVDGWSGDGKHVLFRSSRESVRTYRQLYTVRVDGEGGLPKLVPLPHADEGSFSPDDARIAYQPISQWQSDWKRHKGGQRGQIWIARMSDSAVERVPNPGSNDHSPVWVGDTVYFISDRGSRTGTTSIFAYDTRAKSTRQVITNDGLDIKALAGNADTLVYEQFGSIFLLDPRSAKATPVSIRVDADFGAVRTRYEPAGEAIRRGRVSPTGARAVFETRGEIVTVPAEKGDPRNVTRSAGVMERDPAWSPDGKSIAYFSEESGEYALYIRDHRGERPARKIDMGAPATFYYAPAWSPDSTKVAYADRRLALWYVDVATGARVKVDTNPIGFTDAVLEPKWSPDSRWIAYARFLPNLVRAVFVHSVASAKSHQVTDGRSDVIFPVFDRNGKYLYFAASTDIGRGLSWADLSGIDKVATRHVYAAVLRNDEPSPIAPESDEEKDKAAAASKDDQKEDKATPEKKKKTGDKDEVPTPPKVAPIRIDLEGIGQRIIALPIPNGNIRGLDAGKDGILFVAIAAPSHFGSEENAFDVRRFELEKRKASDFLSGVHALDVSANGEKVLFRRKNDWTIAEAAGEPKAGEGKLSTNAIQIRVEPRAEWRQMFRDAWLGERDHFYDTNHHGLNLDAARKLYEPYLDAVAHRADLNYLFREMLNQLTIGHMFVSGGDLPSASAVPGGLLGCDYAIENGRYRFTRVYSGENWNPELQAPLTQPGVQVKAGEYLLSVGGYELTANTNVYAAFENTAGKQVSIRVGPKPDGSSARDVIVVPIPSEAALRRRAWIESNRRKVDALSGGRLAYIYIPDTGNSGYTSFNRDFFVQTEKEGAVVDERFNEGGLLADYVVNLLTRPQLSAIAFRYAEKDVPVPAGAIYGPKAMLINGMAGSGGDALPWYFRKMKVGPLVGTRTWGGLVASIPGPTLMDGGRYTAPDAAVYGLDGKWEVENEGVAPDLEVELDPAEWRKGKDTQLGRAVEYLLGELTKNPRVAPVRPTYPVYERCCGLDVKK